MKRIGLLSPIEIVNSIRKPQAASDSSQVFPCECGSALADFLKRHLEATKFLRTQFREHFLHLPGMLSKS